MLPDMVANTPRERESERVRIMAYFDGFVDG